ncbi:hypothetical protein C8F01DRAFT_1301690 [Mycena amicta]|nr:hypothetical protein C8F01DRAFT_1301690 [Mycena amicta]
MNEPERVYGPLHELKNGMTEAQTIVDVDDIRRRRRIDSQLLPLSSASLLKDPTMFSRHPRHPGRSQGTLPASQRDYKTTTMFLRNAFFALSAVVSLLRGVDTPAVELGSSFSFPSYLDLPVLPSLPAADFPLLSVSSLYDKPAPISFSPANLTAIRQPFVTVVGQVNRGLAVNETFASIPKDVSWVQLILVAAEVVQDGQWEDVGYIAYQVYVLVRSAQLDLADLISLLSLLDIPFTDLLWVPVLLVALESTPVVPFLVQNVHQYGRKALPCVEFLMALGGVLVTTPPHFGCIVVGHTVPIMVDNILRQAQARKIDCFLNLVVRTVLDIGIQGIVLVFQSRHWAIVGRAAYKAFCLLGAFFPTFVESLFTAFDVPAADLIWITALLFALDSTAGILFLANDFCWRSRHYVPALPMDRFLVRIVNTTIAASLCAIRAGSSFAKWLSFAVLDLFRTASRFLRLSMAATYPYLRIVVLHLYYLPARYLYRAKRIWAKSKKMLRPVVAQVSVITDIAFRVVVWVGGIPKPSVSPILAQSTTNESLEPEATAAPIRLKKRNRADKRYQRGKKLHVDVEEKGKRKRA